MSMQISLPMTVVMAAVLIAMVTDLRTLKVHNVLTLPLLAAGLVYGGVTGGWSGLAASLTSAGLGFLCLLIPYVLGGMGAGDVKLAAALGAWLGPATLLTVLAIGLFASAVYSLVVLLRQNRLRDAWTTFQAVYFGCRMLMKPAENVHQMAQTPEGRRRLVPFSAMAGFGVLTVVVCQNVHVTSFWGA